MIRFFLISIVLFSFSLAWGQEGDASSSAELCTLEVPVVSAIGPSKLDLINRAIQLAESKNCGSILLMINTPGGSLQSTRLIVEKMLNSKIPFLCLVGPSGAQAGSAGAIIMQACHIAGGLKGTNIGAATPVSGGGQEMGEDMRNKIMNDTRSWVESMAKLRGRSEQFARDIVEQAKAVSSTEALELNAIEWVGDKKEDFLEFANGREVSLSENTKSLIALNGETVVLPLDFRYQVLDIVSNPQFAYLIFMGSLGLLYFELTNPGAIVPGVIGAVGLVISMMSMHMLDVSSTGILLILLGLGLMIGEAFVPSFGALGLGGTVAFFLGSLFLYDPSFSGYSLPLVTILPTTLLLGLLMIGVAYLAMSTRKRRDQSSFDVLLGKEGHIKTLMQDQQSGQVEVFGELWGFRSDDSLAVNDEVVVIDKKGFQLIVKKISKESV